MSEIVNQPTTDRGHRKERVGEVISNKMTKTIVVRVDAGRNQPISATVGTFAQTTDQDSVDNSATVVTPIGTPDPRPYKRYVPGVARD